MEGLAVTHLATTVQEIIPGVDVSVNPDAQPDKRSYKVNFSRYASLAPNHMPPVSLQESIRDLRDGPTKAGYSDANFRDPRQIRLSVLAGHRESGRLDDYPHWTHA